MPSCFLADRYPHLRVVFISVALMAATILCALIVGIIDNVPRYVFLCLLTACIWTANPIAESYASSSMASIQPEVRAISLAFINSMGNTAQIYGSYLLPSSDAPRYVTGFSTFASLLFFWQQYLFDDFHALQEDTIHPNSHRRTTLNEQATTLITCG